MGEENEPHDEELCVHQPALFPPPTGDAGSMTWVSTLRDVDRGGARQSGHDGLGRA